MRKKYFYSTGEPGQRNGIYCECSGEGRVSVFLFHISVRYVSIMHAALNF